jgi:hypothetical protein
MYEGHTNVLIAVLVILPARWATSSVALRPLSVPFGPTGIDVPGGYIYEVDNCDGPQFGVAKIVICVVRHRATSRAERKRGGSPMSKFE